MSYPFQINWAFVFLQIHHNTTQLHPSNKRAAVSFFYESRASTFVSLCAQVRTSKDGAGVSTPNNIFVIKETLLCQFTDFKKNAVLVWFCRCCYGKYDDEDWAKHLKRKKKPRHYLVNWWSITVQKKNLIACTWKRLTFNLTTKHEHELIGVNFVLPFQCKSWHLAFITLFFVFRQNTQISFNFDLLLLNKRNVLSTSISSSQSLKRAWRIECKVKRSRYLQIFDSSNKSS